jgi:chromosome partitioning protein
MRTILVASSKGGAGKSTVSTNLAAHFAVEGKRTVLLDADKQHSATHWCEKRAEMPAAVLPVDGTAKNFAKQIPENTQVVVIDGAAGSMAAELAPFLEKADAILVPILPSAIDIEATVGFLNSIVQHPRVKKGKLPVGLVANRLKPWTNASSDAVAQLKSWPYSVVGELRDTQAYVLMASLGKSVFDYHSEQIRSHQEDWAPILKWLKKVA